MTALGVELYTEEVAVAVVVVVVAWTMNRSALAMNSYRERHQPKNQWVRLSFDRPLFW